MSGEVSGDVQQFTGVVGAARCADWLRRIEAALDEAAAPVRPCSLRLNSLSGLFDGVQTSVCRHTALKEAVHARLGPRLVLLADHCWVRHQPAPRHRQPGQIPHSWHQDGALAFDFMANTPPYPRDALLPMLTCWLPLTPCGIDAPSLAWVDPPLPVLLAPQDIRDDAVAGLCAAGTVGAARHAVLSAGDGLLFDGGLLHRTHATPEMTYRRISVELRWLPADAVPARLAGGRILRVG